MDEFFKKAKEIESNPLVVIIQGLLIFNLLIIISIECYCSSIKDANKLLNQLPFIVTIVAMMLGSIIPIMHLVVKKLAKLGRELDCFSIKAIKIVGGIIFAFDVLLLILIAKDCISITDESRNLGTYIVDLLTFGNL